MNMLKLATKLSNLRILIQIALIILALIILVPKFSEFIKTPINISNLQVEWLFLAVVSCMISYMAAAGVYWALVGRKILFARVLLAQIATLFTNRLLPGGLGGMGTFVRFLKTQRISFTESTVAVGANQLIGAISFALLSVVMVLTTSYNNKFSLNSNGIKIFFLIVSVISIIAWVVYCRQNNPYSKKLIQLINQSFHAVAKLAAHPTNSLFALFCSVGISIFYALCLYASLQAVNIVLSPVQVLMIYMGGSVAGSITPTPGGLGGVEAALVVGLKYFGVSNMDAISGVILFRIISFWLPIIPGFMAFRVMLRRKWL